MSDLIHSEDGGYIFTSGGFDDFFLLKTASDPVSVPRLIDPAIIDQCQLQPCYPNPFNSSTTISFSLPLAGRTQVRIFNPSGKEIAKLLDINLNSGPHSLKWTPFNCTSGHYYCQISSKTGIVVNEIILLK